MGGGGGCGGGERGRIYTYRYIVNNGMTSASKSAETIRLIRDWEKGGRAVMKVGEEGDYIPIATL